MTAYRGCCESTDEGARLRVRVSPRAKRTEVAGTHGDALKVRVAAPPADGEANEALLAWLARALGVRASDVELVAGHRAREKVVAIAGLAAEEVLGRLDAA